MAKKATVTQTPAASDEVIGTVVAQINKHVSAEALAVALFVGKLVVDTFFGGDVDAWRQRGEADASYRKLAARSDLEISRTTLYYALGIYQLSQEIGDFPKYEGLSYSHLRSVIGQPIERQRDLLTRAKAEGWSVDRLRSEIGAQGSGKQPAASRPTTEVRRAFRQLSEILDDQDGLIADINSMGTDPTAMVSLAQSLDMLRAELFKINEVLPASARFTERKRT